MVKESAEETLVTDVEEIAEETLAAVQNLGIRNLGQLASLSACQIVELREKTPEVVWEIEDALEKRGLRLRCDPEGSKSSRDAELSLDEWVGRLAEVCPEARTLTTERVRAVMQERFFDMDYWERPRPPAEFKYVLYALARHQKTWLYASDWKGSRPEAARAFERLLGLPTNSVTPYDIDPLSEVANDANRAARRAGRDRLLYDLEPFDDYCVFALMSPALRDAMVAAQLVAPCEPA